MFVWRFLESLWQYDRRDYSLTNNNVNETLHFLKYVIRESELDEYTPVTPFEVLDALWKSRIIVGNPYHKIKSALGYWKELLPEGKTLKHPQNNFYLSNAQYFPSGYGAAKQSFDKFQKILERESIDLPWTKVEAYLASSALERENLFESFREELKKEVSNTMAILEGTIDSRITFRLSRDQDLDEKAILEIQHTRQNRDHFRKVFRSTL